MRLRIRLRSLPASSLLVLMLAGCFNPFDPRVGSERAIPEPAPRPDSPRNALRLFEWCWEHQSIAEYRELFTDDFRFAFAVTDSFGNAYRERGFTRDDELASATNLFLGGDAGQPRANRITLDFDQDLIAFSDSRPGKDPLWHKEIFTRVLLTVESDLSIDRVNGSARFFLVRGDSALIPQELENRGFGPDTNRWYIERYEEEGTGASAVAGTDGARAHAAHDRWSRSGAAPHPRSAVPAGLEAAVEPAAGTRPEGVLARLVTWGRLKVVYR